LTPVALIHPGRNPGKSPISRWVDGIARWGRDRRGVVAVLFALAAPVLGLALGAGIEVSRWSVAQVELQRVADAAALAGVFDYEHQPSSVAPAAAAEAAGKAAANLAQINGVTATASPVWNATTQTFPDGLINVKVVSGVKNTGDFALQVTVTRAVPLFLAGFFTKAPTKTVSATAIAELVTTSATTGTACVLALEGDSTGITTDVDFNFSNGVTVNTSGNCALRSDGDVILTGGVDIGSVNANADFIAAGSVTVENGATVDGSVTAGSIAVTGGGNVTGSVAAPASSDISVNNGGNAGSQTTAPNPGQVSDPFAQDTTLQNALQSASTQTGTPESNCNTGNGGASCTINPGNFSTISNGNGDTLTLNPGLYTVNGPVNFGGGTVNFAAGGVTIVSNGAITVNNGVTIQTVTTVGATTTTTPGVSAPTPTSATGGAIPGVLFATNASGNAVTFGGGAAIPFAGLLYAPNGTVTISNGVSTSAAGCSEIVASVVQLAGGANFASNTCTQNFGLTNIPSQTTTTESAVLVQ
jgi:Flp pilus assembly protein TadG